MNPEIESTTVPALHGDDSRGTLRLSWARLRSPYPERTPIVFLAGGPGDSGIAWLNHPPFREVFEYVAETRDVILLDQRGCGQSEQDTTCAPPDFRPGWLRDQSIAFDMLADQARATLAAKPELKPEFYTPWQSAKDLAFIADALGFDRIHLWGYSYGTHLAMAAMKAVPNQIDRVALCGFEGLGQTYKSPLQIHAQVERLAELARRQSVCDDVVGLMSSIHESLEREPITVLVADGSVTEVGRCGLQWLASTWIGVSNRFKNLPALYLSLNRGETAPLQKAVQGFTKMLTARPAVYYLNDSASGADDAWLAQIRQQTPDCVLGNAANFPFPQIGDAWGQKDLGNNYRSGPRTDRSVFVVTGSFDGFTPTDNATLGIRDMPNAIHAEIANAAHNDLLSCPAAVRDTIRFFAGDPISPDGYYVLAPKFVEERPQP